VQHRRRCNDTPAGWFANSRTGTVALPFCHLTLRTKKPKDSKYPTELRTIGDHLKRRRLDLGLLQRQVAERLRVSVENVRNWEWSKTKPEVRFLPVILDFLGYDPDRRPASHPEALRKARRAAGLSQETFAEYAGFDETTIAKWERGDHRPMPGSLERLRQFCLSIDQPLPDFGPASFHSSSRRAESARAGHATRRSQGR
jgi:transcriptional regulator with XRE-family HTH domain